MAHLSTLIGFFLSIPVAAGLLGPLMLWLLSHGRDAFVAGQAREALNFHASVLLAALLLQVLPLSSSVVAVLVVLWLVLVVVAAGLAYEGRAARYPVSLPIVRPRRVSRG